MKKPKPPATLDQFLFTVSDVVQLTRICRALVYRDIKSGALPAFKRDRATLVKREDLLAYIDKLTPLTGKDPGTDAMNAAKGA